MEFQEFNSDNPYSTAQLKAKKALEFYEDGQVVQALLFIQDALAIDPDNAAWHFNKGLALDSIARYEEAIEEFELAQQLQPDDLETLNCLAMDYTRCGFYDRALEVFEYIQQLDPDFEPAYCNRIITYTEMGLHEHAEEMFYLAQQIEEDCELCFYNFGNSLFVRGQYTKAIKCWQKTEELEPEHLQINLRLGQAFWADGQLEKAKEHFLEELRRSPGDVEVIFEFGIFLLEQGYLEAAKEKFHRILEFEPDWPAALFYLGEIELARSNIEEAKNLFNKSLQSCGDDGFSGPFFRLAQIASKEGHIDQSRAYLLNELRNGPQECSVLTAMGAMFMATGEYNYALDCFLRAVEQDPNDSETLYFLGVISAIRNKPEDALEFFEQSLKYNDSHFFSLRESAAVLLNIGKTGQALKQIERAVSLNPKDKDVKKLCKKIRLVLKAEKFEDFVCRHLPVKTLGKLFKI